MKNEATFIPPGLPKTGQTVAQTAGDDGTFQAGYAGTRFQDLDASAPNLVRDNALRRTGNFWPKDPRLIIPGTSLKVLAAKGSYAVPAVAGDDNSIISTANALNVDATGLTGVAQAVLYVYIDGNTKQVEFYGSDADRTARTPQLGITDNISQNGTIQVTGSTLGGAITITNYGALAGDYDITITFTQYAAGDVVRDAAGNQNGVVPCTITGVSIGATCTLTCTAGHVAASGLRTGDMVLVAGIVGTVGTALLNGNSYYVKVSGETLALFSNNLCTTDIDSTGKAYTSGGTATQTRFYACKATHWARSITLDAASWAYTPWITGTNSTLANWLPRAWAWTDAVQACSNNAGSGLTWHGIGPATAANPQGWRLPNKSDLVTIWDAELQSWPAAFAFTAGWYFSSTPYGSTLAYPVGISGGGAGTMPLIAATTVYYVLPIRGGVS